MAEWTLAYRFGSFGAIGYGGYFCDDAFPADMPLVGSALRHTGPMCNVPSRVKGCLNFLGHVGKELPENVSGEIGFDGLIGEKQGVIFPRFTHCSDPLCPLCCYDFARRQARRAMAKFKVLNDLMPDFELRHVIVSVPRFDWAKGFGFLRSQATNILSAVGVEGGLLLYHPKRWDSRREIWYFSPHFHCLGYVRGGWLDGVLISHIHGETEYVIKNMERRKSVLGTLLYQLSHAGVPSGHAHVVSWFGCCAPRAIQEMGATELIAANIVEDKRRLGMCPVCGAKMSHVCRVEKAKERFDYVKFEEKFVLDPYDNWATVFIPHRKKKAFSQEEEDAYAAYSS